jgi:hypothetical protein
MMAFWAVGGAPPGGRGGSRRTVLGDEPLDVVAPAPAARLVDYLDGWLVHVSWGDRAVGHEVYSVWWRPSIPDANSRHLIFDRRGGGDRQKVALDAEPCIVLNQPLDPRGGLRGEDEIFRAHRRQRVDGLRQLSVSINPLDTPARLEFGV